MRIAVASDHGGYELKNKIIPWLREQGHEAEDLGTDSSESTDYPIYGKKCAERVMSGAADKGIVLCGTGIGVSLAANKVKGARCALVANDTLAQLAANHNDANLIALGGRTTSFDEAKRYIEIWLSTPFDGGERHTRRVKMLNDML